MNKPLRSKLIKFFTRVKNPSDSSVHRFADKLNIDPDELEEEIYGIMSSLFSAGKYNENSDIEIDDDELEKGVEVEMEHTDCPLIAKRIALDHLAELSDYYTRLEKMEHNIIKSQIRETVKEVMDEIEEVAPPGMEDTVMKLKRTTSIDNPFALAWWIRNRKKKK
jgi:hypothetical protein